MKTLSRVAPVILLIFATVLVLGTARLAVPVAAAQAKEQQTRTIVVSGQAQLNVPPDVVIITMGVETSEKTIAASKRQNDERIKVVLTLMKGLGIDPDSIKVDYLSVGPRYYGSDVFQVRRTVVITLKDIARFDDLVDAILQLEGSNLLNVDFRTSELRKYRDQARSLAMKAAKEKADAMAGELGQKVGRPISIVEDQNNWWSYYNFYSAYYGYGRSSAGANVVQNVQNVQPLDTGASAVGGDTSVAPGQISVQAKVTVTFELAD